MVIGTTTNLNLSVSQLKEADDQTVKAIWEKQYPLKPFVDPSNFKTYDELKEKLNRITGTQNTTTVDEVDIKTVISHLQAAWKCLK